MLGWSGSSMGIGLAFKGHVVLSNREHKGSYLYLPEAAGDHQGHAERTTESRLVSESSSWRWKVGPGPLPKFMANIRLKIV